MANVNFVGILIEGQGLILVGSLVISLKKVGLNMLIKKIVHSYDYFKLDIRNVELSKNKIIGLIGENGAGKTTLMDILSQMVVTNHTFEVEEYDENNIMYIPSDMIPYDFLTVKEFCEIVIEYTHSNRTSSDVIEELGLSEKKDSRIAKLSQGMKKKLSLINLFLNDYSLIILDEPFNSVDLKYSYQMKDVILKLRENSTVLISSHIIDSLIDICDEFIYLEDGIVKKKFSNTGDKEKLEAELFG